LLAAALVAGCSPELPQTTLHPTTDFGASIDHLFRSILAWEIGIFVVVEALLIFAVLRFRKPKAAPAGREPEQVHGHTGLEIAWTLVPAIILVFIGVPTIYTIFRTQAKPPADSMEVDVIGHQWWWEFRYPGQGVVTAYELHLPQGRPVHFVLTSADVIHSFWVPKLGGKRDVIPARTNHLWFTPDSTGAYPGQCAEFCGESHANMRLLAVIEPPDAFAAWVAAQKSPALAPPPGDSLALAGADIFKQPQHLCITCHTVNGVSGGLIGPNLSHVGSRHAIASGVLANSPEEIARWLSGPAAAKPGAQMPTLPLSPDEKRALAAYLTALR
jgi:cytochrome c oxidase subunit 2